MPKKSVIRTSLIITEAVEGNTGCKLVSITYWALAPDEVSLFFSEEALKSTPPKPILGAGAAVAAVEVLNKELNVNPPPPPRVD